MRRQNQAYCTYSSQQTAVLFTIELVLQILPLSTPHEKGKKEASGYLLRNLLPQPSKSVEIPEEKTFFADNRAGKKSKWCNFLGG